VKLSETVLCKGCCIGHQISRKEEHVNNAQKQEFAGKPKLVVDSATSISAKLVLKTSTRPVVLSYFESDPSTTFLETL
jgi:hypothetical protein